MKYCENCKVNIKGDWSYCPLCTTTTPKDEEEAQEVSSFLNIPLRYNRQKALNSFFRMSLMVVVLFFIIQLIRPFHFFGLQYVLFGLFVTWTIIVILIQKHHNFAKATVYLLFIISLASLYLDYTNGWTGWSITFSIPIMSISSLLAIFIGIQSIDLKISDYILYLQLVALFGVIPLLFLIMDWVRHPLPSLLSVILSVLMFIGVFLNYRSLVIREFQKRMHL